MVLLVSTVAIGMASAHRIKAIRWRGGYASLVISAGLDRPINPPAKMTAGQGLAGPQPEQSMIRKSASRFSDTIMLH
jgi:hypothetical protein